MLDQPRRPWRPPLIAALIFVLVVFLITRRSTPIPPIVEARESIDAACGASQILSNSFFFSFAEEDPAASRCTDALRLAASNLGFPDAAVSETIGVESNAVARAGSFRLSSQLVYFDTPDSSFEVVMVEIASCERVLLDVSSGFEVSQLMDRVWSSACDSEFYIGLPAAAPAASD